MFCGFCKSAIVHRPPMLASICGISSGHAGLWHRQFQCQKVRMDDNFPKEISRELQLNVWSLTESPASFFASYEGVGDVGERSDISEVTFLHMCHSCCTLPWLSNQTPSSTTPPCPRSNNESRTSSTRSMMTMLCSNASRMAAFVQSWYFCAVSERTGCSHDVGLRPEDTPG